MGVGRVEESLIGPRRESQVDRDFPQAIAKIAVAQICESAGFQGFQQSALETLSEVVVRYIRELGKTAHTYANSACRTECNIFDIIQGLEDLASLQGFSGASDSDHCLAGSGTVREIVQYVSEAEEIPFAHSVPHFPVIRDRKQTPSFLQIGEEPPGITFPIGCLHFLIHKLMFIPRCCKARRAAETNPFLSAPLHFGEKGVSPVFLPAKLSNEAVVENQAGENHAVANHVSVLETFAPAIELMKSRSCESEEGRKKVLSNQRPAVQFKIEIGKKSTGTALDLSFQNKDVEKITSWFGKDNEKDDKKRRAEKILKESMKTHRNWLSCKIGLCP
ncbi:Transcription initiation factor TFIID subunit 8 [Vitis vinifera]|uniref:Transcription initiation factor TFIID subunit 8 n=1 Tax=Vitis vinifera TaxID=29760 RepID=A0A438D7K8_VITVI|nr:Transcription initiation factor TFIID subunit 8 [Vitis vinifera]